MHSDPVAILLADDDPDDRLLTSRALQQSEIACEIRTVEDGEELMDYLYQRGAYAAPEQALRPTLILLDLNMPRKDGREALREIKQDPKLRRIPVIVLTTSDADEDIAQTYDLGVNAFVTKPPTYEGLSHVIQAMQDFWFSKAKLP